LVHQGLRRAPHQLRALAHDVQRHADGEHRLLVPQPIEQLGWGLLLAVLSSALNGALAWMLFRAASAHRSIALEADARHLVTDVWTSAAVVAGLIAVHFTGWLWLDPVLAIGVALNIVREGAKLVWRSSQALMDQAFEPEAMQMLQATLERFAERPDGERLRFDDIATRRAGQRRFADLHMHAPGDWSLQRAAALRDELELALMEAVPGLRVTIQLLPLALEARGAVADRHEREARHEAGVALSPSPSPAASTLPGAGAGAGDGR
ncbi:MAG: cation diffusion facilitator family transporter, partial [Comamonadaceae bacterium]